MSRLDKIVEILVRFDVKPSYSQTADYNSSIDGFRSKLARRIMDAIALEQQPEVSEEEIEDLYNNHLTTVNTGIHMEDQMLLKNFKEAITNLLKGYETTRESNTGKARREPQ